LGERRIIHYPQKRIIGLYEKSMALIICPECNQSLSDTAEICPHCGYRLKVVEQPSNVLENATVGNTVEKSLIKKSNKKIIILGAAVIAVVLIVIIAIAVKNSSNQKKEAQNAEIYSEAKDAMNSYDYEQAQELLESIPEYKDSKELMDEAENGEFLSQIAQDIFAFIKDGGFYNPSAVRLLNAAYTTTETDSSVSLVGADYVVYFQIQGTNKLGGTLTKEYVYVSGGDYDGKVYTNDESGWDYTNTEKTIDYSLINKMLQKYWSDAGITD
jgi:uncharacterized membrane protein YvbJ